MKLDWKVRLRNKAFWVALFSLLGLIGRTFGVFEVPDNYELIVDIVLSLFVALGVVIDPSTPGIWDNK